MTTLAQYEPEEALAYAQGFLRANFPKTKPEYVWSVVHHEYGTWLHLDVIDLDRHKWMLPVKGRKPKPHSRRLRYREAQLLSLPVREIPDIHASTLELGRCKSCTLLWRNINGYGSEDDIDAIDDLPSYKRREQLI